MTNPITVMKSIHRQLHHSYHFKLGETYEITLKFTRPTECHFYQGIYYSKDLNTRTIAIQTAVDKDQACVQVYQHNQKLLLIFM
jgi:hypothetical protein